MRGVADDRYELVIYDLIGRVVFNDFLVNSDLRAKTYNWEGIRNDGSFAGTGIYFVKFQNFEKIITRKITLLK